MSVKDKVLDLLSEVSGRPRESITPDQAIFGGGLNLDSLSGVNLIAGLNKVFGISMDDVDIAMDSLDSVGSLMGFLTKPAPAAEGLARLALVAEASRLKEGRAGVERILAVVGDSPGLTSRELAAACALPTPTVSAVRKELAKAGLLEEVGKGARLTDDGSALVRALIVGGGREGRIHSDYLQPRNLTMVRRLEEALAPLFESRPSADTALDQAKCLPGTSAARAVLAMEYGVLSGRSIAFMGDDDFTSVAVGMLGAMLAAEGKFPPARLTVFDIDERILETIRAMSKEQGLSIDTVRHDMRDPLPAGENGGYDAFFTDPPYTPEGAALFVSRGVAACRGRGCLGFFSFAAKGPEDMFRVHASFNSMGLLVREVMPGFNRYEGASLWGNQSVMTVLEAVHPTPAVAGEERHQGPMYTAEFRKPRDRNT